ncbi:sensor histidine kinase [Heliorestis convoluta]|uniref:histidine kinase n=1 Tax=Heliorestis convoluta TaxID=356322 RepID=A0A5Q2N472_9FIRM|nr:HAMP domain-containing sensor histidine kinase [Heliorestis convoluta]QGG48396.1 signal transduction histidine kinase [Heliorestis convoluta]
MKKKKVNKNSMALQKELFLYDRKSLLVRAIPNIAIFSLAILSIFYPDLTFLRYGFIAGLILLSVRQILVLSENDNLLVGAHKLNNSLNQAIHEEKILNEELEKVNKKLEQLNHDLEENVRVRTKELLVKNEELVKANQLKEQFVATVSHELKTPLHGIIGFGQVLEEDLKQSENKKHLSYLLDSAYYLQALVESLLNFSKLNADQSTLYVEEVNVVKLAHFIAKQAEEKINNKNLYFELQIAESVNMHHCDEMKLRQILINLLDNAIKYTLPGGRVHLAIDYREETLFFVVEDTGIGIPADKVESIFEPFFQIDNTLSRRHGGTGLGLSIVKKLVELFGGTIEVESEVGKGTKMYVTIPEKSRK